MRKILHSDMNNFYASVECMLNPSLRGKPVAVCGSVEERHGIVLAKNYPAKAYGVQTGEAVWQAKQKCRDIIIVPPHYDEYIKYSRLARNVYVAKEENLSYFKGKMLVNKNIKLNHSHKERIYLRYDEFSPNRPENKLIKSTLLKLSKLTSSAENSKEIRQLLTGFELVEQSKNIEKDFASVNIDRTTKNYENLMVWSKVFLLNKSFTTFSGSTQSRALLFPMEKVFESYVAQQLRKVFVPDGWEVSLQDKGYYLFEEPRRQFSLRPDIVIRKGDRVIVMDTKWKSLCDNEAKNYGISQADMYQMYAYSKKYQTSEIWLIYPVNQEMRNHSLIRFDSGDGTRVSVFLIDLQNVEKDLIDLKKLLIF